MSYLVGNVASDLVKIGVGAIMSAIFGLTLGATTSLAAAPIFVALAVGVATGLLVEQIDTRHKLTIKLIAALEHYSKELTERKRAIEEALGRELQEAERKIIFRLSGFDINNPSAGIYLFR